MLELRHVCVDYGADRVVDDLNLTLEGDEILMLVGPTGCGKTTILNAIAGLVPLTEGVIRSATWDANARHAVPPEKRHLGMVFQDFALFPHLSVADNVAFRLRDRAPAERWIEALGLAPLRDAKPGRLSGGQKQRVALARALAHEPALLLLDEPLSNLDAALKETLRWEIRDAVKDAGIPAVWVTHDQVEALSVGDRLGVMESGKLVQVARPEDCYLRPATRFAARFLGLATLIGCTVRGGVASCCFGELPTTSDGTLAGPVELLLRPEDIAVSVAATGGVGTVLAASFEGGTWLYRVRHDAAGDLLVRTHHEVRLATGQRVDVEVIAAHPVAIFPAASSPPR